MCEGCRRTSGIDDWVQRHSVLTVEDTTVEEHETMMMEMKCERCAE